MYIKIYKNIYQNCKSKWSYNLLNLQENIEFEDTNFNLTLHIFVFISLFPVLFENESIILYVL